MKFPLEKSPFPKVTFSQAQCDAHEANAMTVLSETIAEYEHFVNVRNRNINKKRWKAVKSRENVTVYKKRDMEDTAMLKTSASMSASSASSTSAGASASAICEWTLPKLLGVGTIAGSLDDVMYGIISPDSECMKVKTSYVEDELLDSRVLFPIHQATMEEPFRFLGLKWLIKGHPASVSAIAKPRDFLYIEGTGIHVLPNGDKLGYHLLQSVDIPECPHLTAMGLVRGTISSCFLFKELSNGTVEVYMKSFIECAGNMMDSMVIMTCANGLIGCWKSVWCAQNKKLAWLLRNPTMVPNGAATTQKLAQGRHCCALCESLFSTFRPASTCALCRESICSRCKIARKLTFVYRGTNIKRIVTVFCSNCVATASKTNGADIARHEYVPESRESGSWRASHAFMVKADDGEMRQLSSQAETETASVVALEDAPTEAGNMEETEDEELETADLWASKRAGAGPSNSIDDVPIVPLPTPDPAAMGPPPAAAPHQMDLWMQMNKLRLQAEQAFRMTQMNNLAMLETTSPSPVTK